MGTIRGNYKQLIPALPVSDLDFVDKPEEIDRFIVRIWPDGTLFCKGSRPRIEEFLRLCTDAGLTIDVDHIALCG